MSKLLKLDRVVIDDTQIIVSGASTSFVNVVLMPEHCIKELKEKRKEVLKLAKSHGTSISYKRKTKQALDDAQGSYKDSYKSYKAHFHLLKSLWESKVKKGIPIGSRMDSEIEALNRLSEKVESMCKCSNDLDVIHNVADTINGLHSDLISQSVYEKITL